MKKLWIIVLLFAGSAHAQFTAEQMCDKIPRFYRGEVPVHIFLDAYDFGGPFAQGRRKTEFYTFQIVREDILLTRLGQLFDDDDTTEGYVTTQNQIPYSFNVLPEGRVLTRIFSYPRRASKNPASDPWELYQLCRFDQCNAQNLSNGQWRIVQYNIDAKRIEKGDVFAFYYRKNRVPPTLNCSDKLNQIQLPDGPFERR